ncbi:MAG: ATP-binding protein [Bacteroidota bacterium]
MKTRLGAALLLPFVACAVQWLLWDTFKPYVWFLFFPAAFFSAWLGGLAGGMAATVISALLVWYVFMPPAFSLVLDNPASAFSIVVFVLMGALFAYVFERLQQAMLRIEEARCAAEEANERITGLYRKTLELDELKSQFFANVSHELRTPLTLIMSPLGRRLAEGRQDDAVRREDEMMLRNARLLYRHVSDLLDAAKLESGRMAIDYASLDLGELVRSTAAQFTSLAKEKGIAYRIETATPLMADVDGEKVQRILLNLLSNAFKFTPDGGRIEVRVAEAGSEICLEVGDSGPGVPDNMREAVFERFRQVEGGAQRRFGGTGLGLAIVKEFAELHGGRVAVLDAADGGARFVAHLPRQAPVGVTLQAAASQLDPVLAGEVLDELHVVPAAPAPRPAPPANAPLVLVVEDNADMNAFIVDILRPHYRVLSAFNGQQGLDKALAVRPDLILSDLMMPVMSGDQMVVALRQQPAMADVPVVMLTAKVDDEQRLHLFQHGVQDYLNKPFAVDELLVRVKGLVTARQRTIEELTRSEAALQEAQQLAGIGSWEWDVAAGRHTWSAQIYRIYGRDPSLPPASYPEVAQYFTPESWAGLAATVEKALAAGNDYECDAEVVRPDGEPRWITARGMATRDASGQVIKLHGTVQDITGRKQAENEIRRLNQDLERRVAERTAELLAANRELDSFAYAVSHDLRAPLRAMSGFSQALVEDCGDQLSDEARTYLEQIGLASHKMGELIDGILALSRSTRGELHHDRLDISALASGLLDELARSEPERKVAWQVEPALQVTGDARMIEAVLGNLLGNAWKYTGRTAAPFIRVSAAELDGRPAICVADNGAGFDMAHAGQLFEPFRRLHRQDEFPGIGIGLATVLRIIRRHGGEIRAEGSPGAGATFCFTLTASIPGATT